MSRRAFRLKLKRPRDLRARVYSWAHADRKMFAEFAYLVVKRFGSDG